MEVITGGGEVGLILSEVEARYIQMTLGATNSPKARDKLTDSYSVELECPDHYSNDVIEALKNGDLSGNMYYALTSRLGE